ncbi:ABC-F family ATP-binding cassette domain-containing protein [Deinococcus sp.]|uniref:ABC-F family ATP-binding cassette domain-containing protein n=1 Tax=Deinococcus sp. TaxID=47478 RepID=UPI0025FB4CA6|nr:ABC-F family ATP-binding cassette domain-containing protein [Deinococcus sp.]
MSVVISHASMSFGDTGLFRDVNFELHAADRVALLGRNGSGKSTLLRLIEGSLTPTAGTVSTTGSLAYLAQLGELPGESLLEAIRPARLKAALDQMQKCGAKLADPTSNHLNAYAAAEETYRLLGGYNFEQRAAEALGALHLDPAWTTAQLSGGQRRRALLAQLLLTPAQTYLLDEPTNHLDWPSLAWLEGWVQASSAAFLIVSHDRAFLDATVTRCCELERGELREYAGNYTEAMAVKETLREARERQFKAHQRKVSALEHEQLAVKQRAASTDRYNPRRKKSGSPMSAKNRAQDVALTLARRAKALEKRLDRMEAPERLLTERHRVAVQLRSGEHGPNDVLALSDLEIRHGPSVILSELNLHVRHGEKIALIGPNGSGKSTLLRTVLGQHPVAGGQMRLGSLTVQWAGQGHEELAPFETQQGALLAVDERLTPQQMYAALARLGLPRDLHHRLADLSGGQLTRLALARLSLSTTQLLVLDEPTNHLDAAAIEALEDVLEAYQGTLIFASHDRQLVSRVATRCWWVEHGRVHDLEGGVLEEGEGRQG